MGKHTPRCPAAPPVCKAWRAERRCCAKIADGASAMTRAELPQGSRLPVTHRQAEGSAHATCMHAGAEQPAEPGAVRPQHIQGAQRAAARGGGGGARRVSGCGAARCCCYAHCPQSCRQEQGASASRIYAWSPMTWCKAQALQITAVPMPLRCPRCAELRTKMLKSTSAGG